jgi:hypothetical protein
MKNLDAAALGKLGGYVATQTNATAARKNGRKGGRPKKPVRPQGPLS